MKKTLKQIRVGENQIRYMVLLVGEPVLGGEQDSRVKQWQMIRTLADQPDLLTCGTVPFEKLRMSFTGSEWIVELEATTDAPRALKDI